MSDNSNPLSLETNNPADNWNSSMVQGLIIPLKNYEPFHKPVDAKDTGKFVNYVDRPESSKEFRKWMSCDDNNCSGTYLITGTRGIGKTSFVGYVIKDLIQEIKDKKKYKSGKRLITISLFILCALLPFFICFRSFLLDGLRCPIDPLFIAVGIILTGVILYLILHILFFKGEKEYIHYININVGNDLKNEREILEILIYKISEKVKRFVRTRIPFRRNFCWVILAKIAGMSFLWSFLCKFLNNVYSQFAAQIHCPSWLSVVIILCSSFLLAHLLFLLIILPLTRILLPYCFKKVGKRPSDIIQSLDRLSDSIRLSSLSTNSDVSLSGSMKNKIGANFSFGKEKKYSMLTVSEIEYELERIINDIQESSFFNNRFIIVFDEWDKMNLSSYIEKTEKNEASSVPSYSSDGLIYADSVSQREKQQCILRIFGQMKYFTSNAHAKFVFIAGHELYDAYLADVSDREFSVSSMFNGVLNLESFLSSKSGESGSHMRINDAIREFVLKAIFGEGAEEDNIDNYIDAKLKYKFKHFYEHFITYLTLTSTGAPKKLISQFEKFVIKKDTADQLTDEQFQNTKIKRYTKITFNEADSTKNTDEKADNTKYYLFIRYSDLQKFGLVHYLTNPIFDWIVKIKGNYSDRLLVSALFMIPHIYKHHSGGFSWRNLEYIPELVESTRIPEMRKFVNSLLAGMQGNNLNIITAGIHNYKFSKSIVEEISFFSRKNEDFASIFNFSLDYFKSVKKFYFDWLAYFGKDGNVSNMTLASMHSHIADILMAEEEYSWAVKHLQISCEKLLLALADRKDSAMDSKLLYVLSYVKTMLRLGLAYEKRNNYDNSYVVYNMVTDFLIGFREINESEFDMTSSLVYDRPGGRDRYDYILHRRNDLPKDIEQRDPDKSLIPTVISEQDTSSFRTWSYGDEFSDNLMWYLSPMKKAIISKLALFEDLRVLYVPILAKLFALEKQNVNGISNEDVDLAISEFDYMLKMTNIELKYLVQVDFYRKLGDILYYKNRNFYEKDNSWGALFSTWNINLKKLIANYYFTKKDRKDKYDQILRMIESNKIDYVWTYALFTTFFNICNVDSNLKSEIARRILKETGEVDNGRERPVLPVFVIEDNGAERFAPFDKVLQLYNCFRKKQKDNVIPLPCAACQYYYNALKHITNAIGIKCCDGKSKANAIYDYVRNENNLRKPSDLLVQMAHTLESIGNCTLSCSDNEQIFHTTILWDNPQSEDETKEEYPSNLDRFLLFYLSSVHCYNSLGEYKHSIECMTDILHVISFYNIKHNQGKKYLSNAIKELLMGVLSQFTGISIQGSGGNSNNHKTDDSKVDEYMFGVWKKMYEYPDVEELLIAYFEYRLSNMKGGQDGQIDNTSLLERLQKAPSLTGNRPESLSQYRIAALNFKVKLNEKLFNLQNYTNKKNEIIEDSIFCLESILKIINGMRPNIVCTNSFVSRICESLAFWKNEYAKEEAEKYEAEAVKYRKLAIQMHSEGPAYQEIIKSFYIIDDDLQNNNVQFYLAYERYRLRCGDR